VVEDACQSFGAGYKGRKSCALSSIGCTTFSLQKPLGCYGTAAPVSPTTKTWQQRCDEIRVHGQDRRYHHALLGINGRMDTLQAAILIAKLEVFADEVGARDRIGADTVNCYVMP